MRALGMILMYGGFLAAAFVAVRQTDDLGLEWQTVEWMPFIAAFVVSLIGVVMVRVTAVRAATQGHKIDEDLGVLRESAGRLVASLATINRNRDDVSVYDVAHTIDEQLMEDLGAFVDAREAMIPRFGLQAYADIMTLFAASERSINRAWSASVDGYIVETHASLDRAETLMLEAHDHLGRLEPQAG